MEKIIELEKKLNQCRIELNNLIIESKSCEDKELMVYKINTLKRQAYDIDQQLNILKSQINKGKIAKPTEQITNNKIANQERPKVEEKIKQPLPVKTKEKNMENIIGKNLMNIFASILIFISIISFASIILPALGDTAKIILMFMLSFAFTGIGLFLQKKNNKNKFYLAITSCGFGSIYISLILSHLYFGIINQYVLYASILAWIIILNIINCEYKIFQIISQIGICFSAFLGVVEYSSLNVITQYFIVIYIVTTELILLVKNIKKDYKENIINNIFTIIAFLILSCGTTEYIVPSFITIVSIILSITFNFLNVKENRREFCFIIWGYIISIIILLSPYNIGSIIYLILATTLLTVMQVKFNDEKDRKSTINLFELSILVTLPIALISAYDSNRILGVNIIPTPWEYTFSVLVEHIIFPVTILFCAYMGFERDRYWHKIASLGLIVLWICVIPEILIEIIALGFVVGIGFILYKNYDSIIKILLYLVSYMVMIALSTNIISELDLSYKLQDLYSFMIIAIYNIVFVKTIFSKNWITKEKEKISDATGKILNIIFMFIGINMYDNINESVVNFVLLTALCIIMFSINSVQLLKKEKIEYGIYVGFKYTLLMWVAVNSISAETYIISILCFIFAIACILYGFNKEYKNIRTYGLLLSIFSVIKLLIFDITYHETLLKTLSFFICGILCFAISMIYNKIDKKQQSN